jgi:exportin-T
MQAVGTRACYLLSRLVKVLRQNMRPLLSDILVRLQPHLAQILAQPLPEAESYAKGTLKIPT